MVYNFIAQDPGVTVLQIAVQNIELFRLNFIIKFIIHVKVVKVPDKFIFISHQKLIRFVLKII